MPQHDPINPIETYLTEVGKQLKRRLPAQLAEQRLAEAREHLYERASELMAGGMAETQAEATAVTAFGPAREWARSVTEVAYADTGAVKARLFATITSLGAFGGAIGFLVGATQETETGTILAWIFFALYITSALAMTIIAFRARSTRTLLFTVMSVLVIVGIGAYVGNAFIATRDGMWRRAQITGELRALPQELAYFQSELHLLQLGLATYATGQGQADNPTIPTELRTFDGGYIVPKPLVVRDNTTFYVSAGDPVTSAFKEFAPSQRVQFKGSNYFGTLAARLRTAQKAPYRSMATESEATSQWRAWGSEWQGTMMFSVKRDQSELAGFRATEPGSMGFSWKCAEVGSLLALILTAPIALLDFVGAHLGRWWYRRRRINLRKVSA